MGEFSHAIPGTHGYFLWLDHVAPALDVVERNLLNEHQWAVTDCLEAREDANAPDRLAACSEARESINGLLSSREAYVLTCLFGLDGGGERSLEAVGHELGRSRERVRQIKGSALRKLRKALLKGVRP